MKEYDCVEVIVEKEKYTREGVHKGMQGWICHEESVNGKWLVSFPQYGEKNNIATIGIKEEDLIAIPQMDARVNEQIKAQFENQTNGTKSLAEKTDDLSGFLI